MACRCIDTSPSITLFPYFAVLVLILAILVVGNPTINHSYHPVQTENKQQYITIGK
nr:MAG: hypothetical protein 3 [Procedovirinae sp.]